MTLMLFVNIEYPFGAIEVMPIYGYCNLYHPQTPFDVLNVDEGINLNPTGLVHFMNDCRYSYFLIVFMCCLSNKSNVEAKITHSLR